MADEDILEPTDPTPGESAAELDATPADPSPAPPDEITGDAPAEPQEQEDPKPPKGVQKRIDELVKQREQERREKQELMQLVQQVIGQRQGGEQAPPSVKSEGPPNPAEYDGSPGKTFLDFQAAHADYIVEQRVNKALESVSQNMEQTTRAKQAKTWADKAQQAYPDFAEVVMRDPRDGGPAITPIMAEAIREDDAGVHIAYHLGKDPELAARIASLHPLRQAVEIGKLGAKFASGAAAPAPKTTTAPPPIKPVGSRNPVERDPDKMNMKEYIAYREAQKKATKAR